MKPKEDIKIIISHKFVGKCNLTDVFIPILYEEIRKQIMKGRTFDNQDKNR